MQCSLCADSEPLMWAGSCCACWQPSRLLPSGDPGLFPRRQGVMSPRRSLHVTVGQVYRTCVTSSCASLQPARTSARRLRIKLVPFQPTTTLGVCSLLAPRLRSPELRDSQDPREITACRVPSFRSNSRSQSSRPATQLASLPRA